MMIRQDFSAELPPKMFLMQIMDDLTKVYCFLWEKRDNFGKLRFEWKDISKHYNKNTFRTSLRKLNGKALLNYAESEDGISIEMVNWDEIGE